MRSNSEERYSYSEFIRCSIIRKIFIDSEEILFIAEVKMSSEEISKQLAVDSEERNAEMEKQHAEMEKLKKSFLEAFNKYDYEKMSILIERIGSPDVLNEAGETPLYLASRNYILNEKDQQMIKYLLEKGADCLRFCEDYTPAYFLIQYDGK